MKAMNWLATGLGILGTAAVAFQYYIFGYVCWIISNCFFIITGIRGKTYYQLTLFSVYQVFSVIGLLKVL